MIFLKEDGNNFSSNTLLGEIAPKYQKYYKSLIVAAVVDNVIKDLQDPIGEYEAFKFIEITSKLGNRIYKRSILYLLMTAVRELYPDYEVFAESTVNKGLYCYFDSSGELNSEMVKKIEDRMRDIVKENRPIVKKILSKGQALQLFKSSRQIPKVNLISAKEEDETILYYCGNCYDYLYGVMMPSTELLGNFEIDFFQDGVLLRMPEEGTVDAIPRQVDQTKFGKVLVESEKMARSMECGFVPDLNRHIRLGRIGDIISISEAFQEKKIVEMAAEITKNINTKRLVLIAGPSSSGKTSFSQRLKIQLGANNIKAISISMDDYFVNRDQTPRAADGSYDYECLEALNIPLFNEHIKKLLQGEAVSLPHYDFITGIQHLNASEPLIIAPNQPIIIEGIHGLNEKMTSAIPRENKYKIYISALTPLNLDMHNRIHTTDARLIRRMVRDYQYRGHSAESTLKQWPIVRAGEDKYIFPFQEEADVVFNSALIYELAALKKYAVPILEKIPKSSEEYVLGNLILSIFRYFESIDDESDIPNNSILREFIGGSRFFDKDGKLKE